MQVAPSITINRYMLLYLQLSSIVCHVAKNIAIIIDTEWWEHTPKLVSLVHEQDFAAVSPVGATLPKGFCPIYEEGSLEQLLTITKQQNGKNKCNC